MYSSYNKPKCNQGKVANRKVGRKYNFTKGKSYYQSRAEVLRAVFSKGTSLGDGNIPYLCYSIGWSLAVFSIKHLK